MWLPKYWNKATYSFCMRFGCSWRRISETMSMTVMNEKFLPAPISYSLPHSPQFFRKFNSTNCVKMSQNTFPFLPIGFEHLLVHCCSGSFSFPFVRSVRQSVVSNQWKELLSRPVNFSEQEKIATDHSELITMQRMSARLNVINRKQLTINKS